jgi:hypothetical protein
VHLIITCNTLRYRYTFVSLIFGVEHEIKKDSEKKGRNYSPNSIHSVCLCKYNARFFTVVPRNLNLLKAICSSLFYVMSLLCIPFEADTGTWLLTAGSVYENFCTFRNIIYVPARQDNNSTVPV